MKALLLKLTLFCLCTIYTHMVYAQCTTIPIPLKDRITNATYILIGEITEQHSYEDKNANIYTLNKVAVHAWAKHNQVQPHVYVITYGGVFGNKAKITTPSLQLTLHEKYLLLLTDDNKVVDDKNTRSASPAIMQALAYAGAQGALIYKDNEFFDAPSGLKIGDQQLLRTIYSFTAEKAKTPIGDEYTGEKKELVTAKLLTPTISSISPNPTNAGTIDPSDFITITGSGFGNVPGKVEFKNADNGGSTYIAAPNS